MKRIISILIVPILLIACKSNQEIVTNSDKDRIEFFENKNFLGDRIEDNSDIAIIRKFFKNNKLVKIKYSDLNDEPVKSKSKLFCQNTEWRFEYDNKGNYIRKTAYNSEGEIMDMEGFWNSAIKEYEYNENNQLIKVSQFDKKGELVELGDFRDAIHEYGYNKKDQLIWHKSFYATQKLIKNGYGFSKYEYNDIGLVNKHTYLFDKGMINQYTLFSYQNGKLVKEEEFNQENKLIGITEYNYEKGRLVKIKYTNKEGEIRFKEEKLSINIRGWKLKNSDRSKLNFVVRNEASGTTGGEYNFTIDKKGKVINIKESGFKGGVPRFNMDVYEKFKKIKFTRTDSKDVEFNGTIKISVLRQKESLLGHLNYISNPKPSEY